MVKDVPLQQHGTSAMRDPWYMTGASRWPLTLDLWSRASAVYMILGFSGLVETNWQY